MKPRYLKCPTCGGKLLVKADAVLPEQIKCPKCGYPFETASNQLPSADSPSPAQRPVLKVTPIQAVPATIHAEPAPAPAAFDLLTAELPSIQPFGVVPALRPAPKKKSNLQNLALPVGIGLATAVVLFIVLHFSTGGDAPAEPARPAVAKSTSAAPRADVPKKFDPAPVAENAPRVAAPVVSSPVEVVPAVDEPEPTTTGPDLKYGWEVNQKYAYLFEAQIASSNAERLTGVTLLTVQPPVKPGETGEEELGTGTAFVVGANGYLVTCAHVVRGASKVEVTLGKKTYVARVLAIDNKRDLAIIHIPEKGLPVVPLADSDRLQLAEEVRVIGFPLSDVLGRSIKVTRGAVAGIIDEESEKVVQVDASINPGNSGGPVFNDQGEVIGIASAKLTNNTASNVGFVVPANDANAMLTKFKVNARRATPGERLEGPELVKRVSPAIGLVTVHAQRYLISYGGRYQVNPVNSTSGSLLPAVTPPVQGVGRLLVDSYGSVVSQQGQWDLPYMLGSAGLIGVESLPSGGAENSEVVRLGTIQRRVVVPGKPQRRSSRLVRPGAPQQVIVAQLIVEKITYTIDRVEPDYVVLKKKYLMASLQKDGEKSRTEIEGDGTLKFDRQTGLPVSMEYSSAVMQVQNGIEIKVPIKLSYKRIDPEERLPPQLANQPRAAAPVAQPGALVSPAGSPPVAGGLVVPPPVAASAAKLSDNEFSALLADVRLGASNFSLCYIALGKLNRAEVREDQREEVCTAVEPLLQDSNLPLRTAAIGALGRWGTPATVGVLLQVIQQADSSTRAAAIRALGGIATNDSAKALVALVPNHADRSDATGALRKMGPVAEVPALALLKHPDYMVRYEACRILSEVGGAKALAAMKKQVTADKHPWSHASAEIALKALASKPKAAATESSSKSSTKTPPSSAAKPSASTKPPASTRPSASTKPPAKKPSASKTAPKSSTDEDDDSEEFGSD